MKFVDDDDDDDDVLVYTACWRVRDEREAEREASLSGDELKNVAQADRWNHYSGHRSITSFSPTRLTVHWLAVYSRQSTCIRWRPAHTWLICHLTASHTVAHLLHSVTLQCPPHCCVPVVFTLLKISCHTFKINLWISRKSYFGCVRVGAEW